LSASFQVHYRSSIKLEKRLTGSFAGSLQRVVTRVLEGYTFIAETNKDRVEITVLGPRNYGVSESAPNSPTAAPLSASTKIAEPAIAPLLAPNKVAEVSVPPVSRLLAAEDAPPLVSKPMTSADVPPMALTPLAAGSAPPLFAKPQTSADAPPMALTPLAAGSAPLLFAEPQTSPVAPPMLPRTPLGGNDTPVNAPRLLAR
jgi:hypothetical protein